MKQLSIYLISFLTVLSVHANKDMIAGAVTITVNGNKNLQISIDGKDYNLNSSDATGNKTSISLNNLEAGQHTFQVVRTDRNTNKSDRISATFNLRYGYNMLIRINGNGSLELIETIKTGISDNREPMSDAYFNILLKNVRNQRSTNSRSAAITNALNNANNYFTTNQVMQFLQLVNSESSRIQLAKLSYPIITDQSNFYLLYELVKSQAGRNDLEDFVSNYYKGHNPNVAMTDANFTTLYQTIQQQWPVSTQMNSLTNAFNNINNYFTALQAKQLIQLVSTEINRLQLAKISYRSIVDRNNFNQIYGLLDSQSGKDELLTYINYHYNDGNSPIIAMSDVNFNTLNNVIKNQWPVSTQMNSLTNAFNNTNNFFTASQAKQLIQIVSLESNRLQLAKLSYRSIVDRSNFDQVYGLLNSNASQNELAVYVNNYNAGIGINLAMPDASFNTLYQGIKNQWPVSTQITSLINEFKNTNNYFTSSQVKQLIQIVSAESDRLQLAKLSYRSITDQVNFSQIYNLLNSQASRNELDAFVNNNYHTGISPNVAMTDANFNTLYQTIQGQYLPFEQMNSLTDVFNNTSNYFSSAQTKQLIPLVSYESNRLKLAKLSYRSITDRSNFNLIYELLSSQSSKDELSAYVKEYKD